MYPSYLAKVASLVFQRLIIQLLDFPCLWRPSFVNESMEASITPWPMPGLHHSGDRAEGPTLGQGRAEVVPGLCQILQREFERTNFVFFE